MVCHCSSRNTNYDSIYGQLQACEGQRLVPTVFLSFSPPDFMRQGLLLYLELMDLASHWSLGLCPSLVHPMAELQTPTISHGEMDVNSEPHDCLPNTLLTESSLHPQLSWFLFKEWTLYVLKTKCYNKHFHILQWVTLKMTLKMWCFTSTEWHHFYKGRLNCVTNQRTSFPPSGMTNK